MKIFREAKVYIKKNKRTIEKQFVVDTMFTTVFWLIVHVCKDLFIVQLTLWQTLLAAVTGAILNLALSGVYGQCLNWIRRRTGCDRNKA